MKKKRGRDKGRLNLETLRDIKPPLLILDNQWQEQFKHRKNERISALENQIIELMKENARLTEKKAALLEKKRESLRDILQLTDSVHAHKDPDAQRTTTQRQKEIEAVNQTLPELDRRVSKIPLELEQASWELLAETVWTIYPMLHENRERAAALEPEIESLRLSLQKASEERMRCEEEAQKTYQLLHNLLGQEILDRLDKQYSEVQP
jgi:hypothetical protein